MMCKLKPLKRSASADIYMMTKEEILEYIEVLRAMPIEEYENSIDAFVDKLIKAGLLTEYEAVVTELDESRDEEFKALYPVDLDELLKQT